MKSPESHERGGLLDREAWNALCEDYAGPRREDEITVTVRGTTVELESHDGVVEAVVYPHRDATDVRVGDVQVLVAKNRVAIVMRRGPYPIKEWEVIWEGDLSRRRPEPPRTCANCGVPLPADEVSHTLAGTNGVFCSPCIRAAWDAR